MESQHSQPSATPHGRPDFTITINERPVTVDDNRMSVRTLKEKAIAQGVPIQLDFVLSEELPNGRVKILADDDVVTLNKNSKFHAVSPDDNS